MIEHEEIDMKTHVQILIAAAAILCLAAVGCADEVEETEDSQLGLEKTSVFDTPDPVLAGIRAGEPGENETWDAYFSAAPPMIPHLIEDYIPIRIGENMCMECHDLQDMIGQGLAAGDPTPIPVSHYTDLRNDPGTVTDQVIGARFTCTQCHAQQADAEPLVANTYAQ